MLPYEFSPYLGLRRYVYTLFCYGTWCCACGGEIRQLVVFTVHKLPTLRVRMKDFHITYLKAVGGRAVAGWVKKVKELKKRTHP